MIQGLLIYSPRLYLTFTDVLVNQFNVFETLLVLILHVIDMKANTVKS